MILTDYCIPLSGVSFEEVAGAFVKRKFIKVIFTSSIARTNFSAAFLAHAISNIWFLRNYQPKRHGRGSSEAGTLHHATAPKSHVSSKLWADIADGVYPTTLPKRHVHHRAHSSVAETTTNNRQFSQNVNKNSNSALQTSYGVSYPISNVTANQGNMPLQSQSSVPNAAIPSQFNDFLCLLQAFKEIMK